MSDGLNRVLLIGNLGQDPELRFTQGGQAVLNLRIATNESYVNKDGERQDRTEWHSVIVWGKRGEGLHKVLTKGKQLFIEGRLQTRSWEDKQGGGKRYATEVVANDVILLGGGTRPGAGAGAGGGRAYDEHTGPSERPGGGGAPEPHSDDDIPF